MDVLQDWVEAYKEICDIVQHPTRAALGIAEIEHMDLWHEQIDYMPEDYPWGDKALFVNFNVLDAQTTGLGVQDLVTEVSMIFVMKSIAKSHNKSDTRDKALEFGNICRKIHNKFQGRAGANFSAMDRVRGPRRIPGPPYLICYEQVYRCIIRDMSGTPEKGTATLASVKASKGSAPASAQSPVYNIE